MPSYQPFWCEENAWHLAADPCVASTGGAGERRVLILSGSSGTVACWAQRAAEPGEVVLWDYHVVLAVRAADGWLVWDQDTRLGCPLPVEVWLTGTFPVPEQVPAKFSPRFLAISAADYRRDLRSDRSHMRTASGGWQHPPPPWPLIAGGSVTLAEYVARARRGIGLEELRRQLTPDPPGTP